MRTNALQAKKALLALFAMLVPMLTSAHDFEVDGIYYKITSTSDLTVAVTYKGSSYGAYTDEYSGVVTIPTNVTYSSKSYRVTSIGNSAFYGCNNLTSITLPEGLTSIGWSAFKGCSSLASIAIPESVTSIEGYAFSYCSMLTSITLSEGLTRIGDYAFYHCSGLPSITLPASVSSIGYGAFESCPKLLDVYCFAQMAPSAYDITFDQNTQDKTLHVPAGALESYRSTTPWSNFGTITFLAEERTTFSPPPMLIDYHSYAPQFSRSRLR